MWDTGLIMFVSLLVLLVWRYFFPFVFLTDRLRQANYSVVLYFLLAVLFIYDTTLFVTTALNQDGKSSWAGLPRWLRPLILASPGVLFVTLMMCFSQTGLHLLKVRSGDAASFHDQVIQVLALPAVYGSMAFSSLTRLYQSHVHDFVDDPSMASMSPSDQQQVALSRSETSFFVGDLFEAWTLYHFGKMTLDVIEASLRRERSSGEGDIRAEASGMMKSHGAVWAMVWASVLMFLLVSFAQVGWSFYLLNFASVSSTDDFEESLQVFTGAGFVASGIALWNIAVIERTFHEKLEGYSPLLKFITVKILVSFAYVQKGCFYVLTALQSTLPHEGQALAKKVPFFGDIMQMDQAHFDLFYAALMVMECFLVSGLHLIAWQSGEDWYEKAHLLDESTPLMTEEKKLQSA
mmetsp:Transcript_13974/g.26092  ORF Transcript_13974/g.26092 Transcript_13974/m.26092 type:complete len:406 (-) Transcript_13974:3-1220(-)